MNIGRLTEGNETDRSLETVAMLADISQVTLTADDIMREEMNIC